MSIEIPTASVEEWLSGLKPYQRNAINQLLESKTPEEAAKAWLASHGPSDSVPFGGDKRDGVFWASFLHEFNKFICDDDEYKDQKDHLRKEEAPIAKALFVSTIAVALSESLGYAAALLAPAIALILHSVGSMTKNAYCATNYKKGDKPKPPPKVDWDA